MARRLLITGALGFIGSAFTRQWHADQPDDHLVLVDALARAGRVENTAGVLDGRCSLYVGHIEDPAFVSAVFEAEPITHVVNFAAESHNDRGTLDPLAPISANALGVGVLLEASARAGVQRFLQVSTDEVYGEIDNGLFRESDPLEPRTAYSAGKASGELVLRAHKISRGTDVVITRGGNTYGPFQYPEKLLPFFITRLLQGKRVPVYGTGEQVRDWIAVEDHARGIAKALCEGAAGEVYNISAGCERRNIDVVTAILGRLGLGCDLIRHIEDPRGAAHDKRYAMDSTRLRSMGWQPEVDFGAGLAAVVDWYRNHPEWWRPIISDPGYQAFVRRYYGRYLGNDL